MNLAGNEQILDLGCGDGALTAHLAGLVPRGHVLGIDASQGMIAAARAHQAGAANLAFSLADISALDFDGQFDLVFSNAALHRVKHHEPLLRALYRALKPGGALRLNFAAEGNCSHFFRVVRQTMQQPGFIEYFAHFDWPWFMPAIDHYSVLVRRLPFTDVRVWGENADRFFPDQEALIKWIDQPSLVPFLQCVPDPAKQQFRSSVIARMLAETRQADGTCFETFRRVNVFAKRPPSQS